MKFYYEPFFNDLLDLSKYYGGIDPFIKTSKGVDTHMKLPGVSKDDCQVEYDQDIFKVTYKDCFGTEGVMMLHAPDINLDTIKLEMKDGILFIKGDPKDTSQKLKIK